MSRDRYESVRRMLDEPGCTLDPSSAFVPAGKQHLRTTAETLVSRARGNTPREAPARTPAPATPAPKPGG